MLPTTYLNKYCCKASRWTVTFYLLLFSYCLGFPKLQRNLVHTTSILLIIQYRWYPVPIFTLFPVVRLFSWPDRTTPPSKSDAPIHELILVMSGQCTNPDPPYPCPVCLCPYIKSKCLYKCSTCWSWVHQRCSGLASPSLHLNMCHCSRCQTPSPSPPKGKSPSPLFPSPTLILPFMGKLFFPPRSPLLTGKGDSLSIFYLRFPWCEDHSCHSSPLLQFNLPLFRRRGLIPLLSIRTIPHLLYPHHHLLLFHLFFPLPPALSHLPLHPQPPPTLRLPLAPPYGSFQPFHSSFLYPSDQTHLRCDFTV